jgi:endonuclease-3
MAKKNIDSVMKKLEKYYNFKKRTTLNRMRNHSRPNAFKILISCLLSLRTKDENTEKVSKKLFSMARTPKQISSLPTKKLEKLIFSSGHYKKKARTLKHVSKVILNKYRGKVPDTEEQLLSIKGIGRKTANIVLCFAFNQCVIPVDVNVHRISNRLGWVHTKNADKTEEELKKILPEKYWRELNGLFILHGKSICVPISPKCSICPINKYCKKIGVKRSR